MGAEQPSPRGLWRLLQCEAVLLVAFTISTPGVDSLIPIWASAQGRVHQRLRGQGDDANGPVPNTALSNHRLRSIFWSIYRLSSRHPLVSRHACTDQGVIDTGWFARGRERARISVFRYISDFKYLHCIYLRYLLPHVLVVPHCNTMLSFITNLVISLLPEQWAPRG